jgi:hypothetical protein
MEAEHTIVTHAAWLSHAKVLKFKEQRAIFLSNNNKDESNLCYNEDCIQKLAYLVKIFQKTK